MKRVLTFLCGMALSLSLAVLLLSGLIGGSAASSTVMEEMLVSHTTEAETGLPADEYSGMATMIAKYLAGGNVEFQYTFTSDEGTEYVCFNTREQTHMADCLQLMTLCRTIMLFSAMAACLLMVALLLEKQRGNAAVGFLTGNGVVLLACVALVVWGLIDFDGLFVRFHQTFFTNDLWLLNPSTDLLIRLMPTQFFIDWAATIAGVWLVALIIGSVGAGMILHHQGKSLRRKKKTGYEVAFK